MNTLINKFSLAVIFVCACGGTPVQGLGTIALDDLEDNGRQLNGLTFNGLTFNGLTFNGLTFNGLTFNGLTFNGLTFNGLTFNGSLLTGQRSDSGAVAAGKDFIGTTIPVPLTGGHSTLMRIDDVAYSDSAGFNLYSVSIQSDAGWSPICGSLNGVAVPAVPVSGTWDSTTGTHTDDPHSFTFACVNAAIGKCVTWGYHPWETRQECDGKDCKTQSLVPWLEACTRLVRADYCGDGVPHTKNGTPINLWDVLGIQLHATTTWTLEAEWARDGAHCIKHTRWLRSDTTTTSTSTDLDYVTQNCRNRLAKDTDDQCGHDSDFYTKHGLGESTKNRRLLRNESALNQ